jgi:hypothetical protein
MTTKNSFLDHACFTLSKARNWRKQQAIRFPDDPRNAVAAQRLGDLASQADDISDDIWNHISPYFDPKNSHYYEAVSRACRAVGFRTNPRNFDDFAQTILDGLVVTV